MQWDLEGLGADEVAKGLAQLNGFFVCLPLSVGRIFSATLFKKELKVHC